MNQLKSNIIAKAFEIGLSDLKFTSSNVEESTKINLQNWIDSKYYANMQYIANNVDKRLNPSIILENSKSVIVCALNYFPGNHPTIDNGNKLVGKISRYAQNIDYHFVLLDKIKLLEEYIRQVIPEIKTRSYVDTGHILEKYFAEKAGIGWQGKHSLIISPKFGSYVFLGVIITDYYFEEDTPVLDKCGTCQRCIVACPTNALVKPKVLDANKCIAYWTVEAKPEEEIPDIVKENNSGWLFGCDICQEVCPYNKVITENTHAAEFLNLSNFYQNLMEVIELNTEDFNKRYKKSPIKRRKLSGLKLNATNLIENFKKTKDSD